MTAPTTTEPKTVYVPYMCDHCHVLGAALAACGIPSEVLPPPDDESLTIGLDLCKGRECLPCFTTTGDLIRRARQPGFEPKRSVFLMATTTGNCRFGQYHVLQRELLDRAGLGEVELLVPSATDNYRALGGNLTALPRLAWQGIVAVDLLQKLRHEYRPYELNPGETDRTYQGCLERVVEATRAGGGRRLVAALRWVAEAFERLPVDRGRRRPIIGLVGEIYIRLNDFSNREVIRQIEAVGGEVVLATAMEWFYFTTGWGYRDFRQEFALRGLGASRDFLTTFFADAVLRHEERRLVKPVEHLLSIPREMPVARLMDHIRPYYSPALNSEALLSLGKAVDFAGHGLDGIVNIMPFSCMPGLITAGMAPRVRADLGNIPWLDVMCDVQGATNTRTRLEAFMYQAVQFQRRRHAALPVSSPDAVAAAR